MESPEEYFKDLLLYPEWVKKTKLPFPWLVKAILREEDKSIQNHSSDQNSFKARDIQVISCNCQVHKYVIVIVVVVQTYVQSMLVIPYLITAAYYP